MNETKHKEKTIQIIRSVYELYEKTFPVTFEEAEAFDSIFNNLLIIEELEMIKVEAEEIRMKEPLMSRGFECYGFKDKTAEDIKTEVIELLENHISELKGECK